MLLIFVSNVDWSPSTFVAVIVMDIVTFCAPVKLFRDLALVEANVRLALMPFVDGGRADQAVVSQLLDRVRAPTGNACDHEDRRVQIDWDIEQVVSVGGWEVDVRIEILLFEH